MAFVLGIDTGGTYTDSVIVDTIDKKIVSKAKALTTKDELTIGIEDCLNKLDSGEKSMVQLVCLSTTLATNAIVEGKGSSIALIYMGFDDVENVPAEIKIKVKGKYDVMGNLIEDIDEAEIVSVVKELKGKVSAIAVSGYSSVRNPKHEKQIMYLIKRETDIPVVCAHQLTSALGFNHRTVTAVLNARLIDIIENLITATRQSLCENGIMTPIMIVKGDGTLMTEEMAKEKPIETILSGPAASVIGGLTLTGKTEAMIMDMGGTTTDIACVTKGNVHIKKEGAKVGGWHTRVQAIEMSTFGVGGDSRIYLDEKGEIHIGPEKVEPLCVAGKEYPNLINELKSYRRKGELKKYYDHETECFVLNRNQDIRNLKGEERDIAELFVEKAHSLSYIGNRLNKDPEVLSVDTLVEKGYLKRIGLTPTDILHIKGEYVEWEKKLSYIGLQIMSDRMEVNQGKLLTALETKIKKKLAMTAIQSAYDFSGEELNVAKSKEAMHLINRAFGLESDKLIDVKINIKKPVIALGAPAAIWLKNLEKYLNGEIVVPEHADVANAYGAAVGQLIETVRLEIHPDGKKFYLNTPWERSEYNSKEEAMFYAIHEGRKHIEHLFMAADCTKWTINEEFKEKYIEIDDEHTKKYIGTEIIITGSANSI